MMSSIVTTLASDIPRLAGLVIALSVALVAVAAYWRRHRPSSYAGASRHNKFVPRPVPEQSAPTIKVPQSQHIERMRKRFRLAPGEQVDVLENPPGAPLGPRFQIALKSVIRLDDGSVAAHIAVEFGGAAVSCGPLVEETAFNEFVVPRASRDEPRNCVFHYHEHGDSLDFMRIKLRSVDMDADIAEIDVMQMSGQWGAA